MVASVKGAYEEIEETFASIKKNGIGVICKERRIIKPKKTEETSAEPYIPDPREKFWVAKLWKINAYITKKDANGKDMLVVFSTKKDALVFMEKANISPDDYNIFCLSWRVIVNVFYGRDDGFQVAGCYDKTDDTFAEFPLQY